MKNILITGGSNGIGYELVKLFSTHCIWKVTTCSRNEEKNQILCSTAECVESYTTDLGNPKEREDFLNKFLESKNELEALILNAAVTGIEEIDHAKNSEEYVREVNVIANKEILEKTLPLLRNSNGVVIFLSSAIHEEDYDTEIGLYAKTKKEFEDYFTEISNNTLNSNVKFIIVRPGMVATRLHQRILEMKKGELFERTKHAVENKKLKNPYVIAKAIKNYIENPNGINKIQIISEDEYKKYLEN